MDDGVSLECDTPSSTIAVIERAFGTMPVTIQIDALPILRGIQAADPSNPTWGLIEDALHTHDTIIVSARY